MLASKIPYKFATPWAADATSGYITATIPATTSGTAASQQLGFPPATSNPTGTPPNIADFNGVMNYETSWSMWLQAGGPIGYDAAFQTAIGGYPNGALIASATTAGAYWRSTADNNTTNPDTGGAGWTAYNAAGTADPLMDGAVSVGTSVKWAHEDHRHPSSPGGLLSIQTFTASGTYTPTAGMGTVIFEVQGGGGAGAGAGSATSTNVSLGAPGTAGSYAKGQFTAATVGASQPVTVGAGGVPVSGGRGGNGGTSSVGTLISAPGGAGGNTLTNQAAPTINGNGTSSSSPAGGGIESSVGSATTVTFAVSNLIAVTGAGGASEFGAGGYGIGINATGTAASNYGAGGGGTVVNASGGTIYGGAGMGGIVIAWEYA